MWFLIFCVLIHIECKLQSLIKVIKLFLESYDIFAEQKRSKVVKNNPYDKKPHAGFKPATVIHVCGVSCEGREEDSENSQRRFQCSCTSLSHEQPRAVGGLRQTRSSSGDPCLDNGNKVELRVFCAWNGSVFIQTSANMLHRLWLVSHTLWILKKMWVLSCPVTGYAAEAGRDTVTQGSVTTENHLIIVAFHLTGEPATCCIVWLANYVFYGIWWNYKKNQWDSFREKRAVCFAMCWWSL